MPWRRGPQRGQPLFDEDDEPAAIQPGNHPAPSTLDS